MVALSGIIILGIVAQWLAWRTRVPAILPLILTGLLVGPVSTLWTADHTKLIEPLLEKNPAEGLFPSHILFHFVSLAIGVILFEGGLTLKRKEIKGVGPAIVKLITIGSAVTFVGAGITAHLVMGLSLSISFLFAGLIIVTGPTVIAPILRNIPLTRNVATVLKWEGILIDPIGALVAVLVFEFIISGDNGQQFTQHALIAFTKIVFIGAVVGGLSAFGLAQLIRRNMIPHYLLNVFTLAGVLLVFVFSDLIEKESGLLSVVVMGMVMGNLEIPRIKEILDFKESLSVLLISILFIILSANIDVEHLELLWDWRCLLLFGVVVLVLRPAGVFLSTLGSELRPNEKIFISWVGPRGIVAAGIASLFGLKLLEAEVPGAEYITPLVFMIVLGTVLLNATTARLIARLLRVTMESSEGILVIGANQAARLIGNYFNDNNRHVVLVDNNEFNITKAQEEGLTAIYGNIYSDELDDNFDLLDMGYLVAMTSNPDVNRFACRKYRNIFGELGTYRMITPDELRKDPRELPASGIFSYTDDYLNISEAARDYPAIHELPVSGKKEMEEKYKKIVELDKSVPLFLKMKSGRLEPVPANPTDGYTPDLTHIVYLGKEWISEEIPRENAEL
jgi:NhaP-type Na+/H+ or K+/H+ antiporter